MVAGLKNITQKLKDMGVGEETHEPVENLQPASSLAVGQRCFLQSDGEAYSGEIFEVRASPCTRAPLHLARSHTAVSPQFVMDGDMLLAGLKSLSDKLSATGCGEVTHEPAENLAPLG